MTFKTIKQQGRSIRECDFLKSFVQNNNLVDTYTAQLDREKALGQNSRFYYESPRELKERLKKLDVEIGNKEIKILETSKLMDEYLKKENKLEKKISEIKEKYDEIKQNLDKEIKQKNEIQQEAFKTVDEIKRELNETKKDKNELMDKFQDEIKKLKNEKEKLDNNDKLKPKIVKIANILMGNPTDSDEIFGNYKDYENLFIENFDRIIDLLKKDIELKKRIALSPELARYYQKKEQNKESKRPVGRPSKK